MNRCTFDGDDSDSSEPTPRTNGVYNSHNSGWSDENIRFKSQSSSFDIESIESQSDFTSMDFESNVEEFESSASSDGPKFYKKETGCSTTSF